ncbi:MAG: energy-coupling factor ABC transporter ATP-binding protein [Proteobacteria bacterium]|nr:energy-coupling factor ABC transporter ATP-binding protein [Pseudomonadota bacterium]
MTRVIVIDNLSYTYPGGGDALTAVTLEIHQGELVLLAGANGSGKSTLLAHIAGLYAPTIGTLTIDGTDDPRTLARLVMQDADLQILGGTVGEDLMLGREGADEATARSTAARLDLLAHWDKPVQTLSWGMKRKLCLAAALLDDPAVLLLDEPFSGLDYPSAREMRAFLASSKAAGMTLVVTVHDLEPVIDLADRMAVLDAGRLALFDLPEKTLPQVHRHGIRPPCSWRSGAGIGAWGYEDLDLS